jgi:hypothetical protein
MKIIQTFVLAVILANMATACNNKTSSSEGNQMKKDEVAMAGVSNISFSDPAKTSEVPGKNSANQIETATKAGKAVFVVVTGTGVTDTDKATAIAKGANAIYKNAVIIQMNRDDASNVQLVSEYRLSGAPLPLILVISSKGFPTGGYILSQATAENIAALVPSPKLEDVYAAIGNKKIALVVFTKKSFADRSEVLKECKNAVSKLNNNAVIVEVDMDNSEEASFMNQLRIDKSVKNSVTLVINTQGQVAGTSTTVPDATKLVAAATAPVKSGCGPGCGPAGCGK